MQAAQKVTGVGAAITGEFTAVQAAQKLNFALHGMVANVHCRAGSSEIRTP